MKALELSFIEIAARRTSGSVLLLARFVFHRVHFPIKIFEEAINVLRNLSLSGGMLVFIRLVYLQVFLLLGAFPFEHKILLLLKYSVQDSRALNFVGSSYGAHGLGPLQLGVLAFLFLELVSKLRISSH